MPSGSETAHPGLPSLRVHLKKYISFRQLGPLQIDGCVPSGMVYLKSALNVLTPFVAQSHVGPSGPFDYVSHGLARNIELTRQLGHAFALSIQSSEHPYCLHPKPSSRVFLPSPIIKSSLSTGVHPIVRASPQK